VNERQPRRSSRNACVWTKRSKDGVIARAGWGGEHSQAKWLTFDRGDVPRAGRQPLATCSAVRASSGGQVLTRRDLYDAIIKGAVARVRPKMMTVVIVGFNQFRLMPKHSMVMLDHINCRIGRD